MTLKGWLGAKPEGPGPARTGELGRRDAQGMGRPKVVRRNEAPGLPPIPRGPDAPALGHARRRRGDGAAALFPDDLDQDAFGPAAVELGVEDLLPGA